MKLSGYQVGAPPRSLEVDQSKLSDLSLTLNTLKTYVVEKEMQWAEVIGNPLL
jgi:hypothetical protein